MVGKIRLQRIADRVREELSRLLLEKVADPRLTGVSITDVRVDRELAYANVFVSAVEGSIRKEEILSGLNSAKGFLRRELTRSVNLRSFPQIRFYWDPIPEKSDQIERLIMTLHKVEQGDEKGMGI